jgi:hypothetical protein
MSAPNCFRASPRQRSPLQQAAKVDWLTSGRGVYAYDLSSASGHCRIHRAIAAIAVSAICCARIATRWPFLRVRREGNGGRGAILQVALPCSH